MIVQLSVRQDSISEFTQTYEIDPGFIKCRFSVSQGRHLPVEYSTTVGEDSDPGAEGRSDCLWHWCRSVANTATKYLLQRHWLVRNFADVKLDDNTAGAE